VRNNTQRAEWTTDFAVVMDFLPPKTREKSHLCGDLITKFNILYYTDAREARLEAIVE
jgi:hypothetical protein